MTPREFFINPADYGLPTRDELVAYRIWDNHFHGFAAWNLIEQYERNKLFRRTNGHGALHRPGGRRTKTRVRSGIDSTSHE